MASGRVRGLQKMVLKPLEFSDCVADSPWFRQNLRDHEGCLEDAHKSIKQLEQQCRELIGAARKLSVTQRAFAKSLRDFRLQSIGSTQTDEERVIANCVREFASLITQVEDQRDRILEEAEQVYIEPLRKFRTQRIGRALHEEKKKFDKASSKFYASLEKHLHLSTNRKNDFREADASLEMEQRHFYQASLDYVFVLQSVQERMKFEFVETLSAFLYSWLSFYHVGHVIHEDFKPYLDDVQVKVQKAKESFKATQGEAEELKAKMLNNPAETSNSSVKQGYLFSMEKKNLGTTWTKYYCVYQKESRIFTMIPYSQNPKQDMRGAYAQSVSMKLQSCTRRASDSIDKRFCFDLLTDKGPEVLTLQAVSEEERRSWLSAMDGKEPVYSPSACPTKSFETSLDETGFSFIQSCVECVEERGLSEQGLYRNCGVTSKVQKLLQLGLDQRKLELNLDDDKEWELRTVTSAVKTYLRNLPEPLMTFELHNQFINAAKMGTPLERIDHIHFYVRKLPPERFRMLETVTRHLKRVSECSRQNLMTVANLGVCFGPTLLRPREESLAAVMDIKFCNVVVEILIEHFDKIFTTCPRKDLGQPCPPKPAHSGKRAFYGSDHIPSPSVPHDSGLASSVPLSVNTANNNLPGGRSELAEPSSSVSHPGNSSDSLNSTGTHNSGSSNSPNRSQGSTSRMSVSYATPYTGDTRRVRCLYECDAGNEGELSFFPGQIITNVFESKEPGWLVGTLNGRTGLVPSNYVDPLP